MRKLICLLLVLCMALALCACGPVDISQLIPSGTGGTPGSQATKPVDPAPSQTAAPSLPPETTEAPTEPVFEPKGKVEIEEEPVPAKWTLKELGPVESGDGTLTIRTDDTVVRYERDGDGNVLYIPADHMGKQLSDERYGYFDKLLPGLFIVSSLEDTVNNTGLMTEEGEMLIPCECAIIREFSSSTMETEAPRFLRVVYATEQTDSKDDAFFYASDSFFSITPQEGDRFYKGYARIYDLENKCFVPDLTITNPNKNITKAGGGLIYTETLEGERIVYNANGKELYKTSDYTSIDLGNGFYVIDYKNVFDTEGNLLYQIDGFGSLQIINGTGRFLNQYNPSTKTLSVVDFYGNRLFELDDVSLVYREYGGFFACTVDGQARLYNAAGELVHSVNDCYTPSYKGHGIWEFSPSSSDVSSIYYLTDGTVVNGAQRYANNLVNQVKEEESGVFSFLPWRNSAEKVSVACSYPETLTDGLVDCQGKPSSLVDCFSGETLLTGDSIGFGNFNYLYVTVDGHTSVYELVLE